MVNKTPNSNYFTQFANIAENHGCYDEIRMGPSGTPEPIGHYIQGPEHTILGLFPRRKCIAQVVSEAEYANGVYNARPLEGIAWNTLPATGLVIRVLEEKQRPLLQKIAKDLEAMTSEPVKLI